MQESNGQTAPQQLPYFREYVEQILKPRVGKIIEEVRAGLNEHVWSEVLERVAMEQGGNADPAAIAATRGLLEQGLRLRMTAHLVADFNGAPNAQVSPAGSVDVDGRENVDVVEGGFPNNPLARAVGGIRRVAR